jgi:hypothetical protein
VALRWLGEEPRREEIPENVAPYLYIPATEAFCISFSLWSDGFAVSFAQSGVFVRTHSEKFGIFGKMG